MNDHRPGGRDWWRALLRESFGRSFWLFAAFAGLMAAVCYAILGPETFGSAVSRDFQLLGNMLPRVAAALAVAGFVWVLLPRERFSQLVTRNRGLRGLIIGEIAGIITPGGPASAFPFLAVIGGAGADRGILVTYITSWALLGVQRILIWDLPFMGTEFATTRFLVCLPLPILAGVIARRLPFSLTLEESARQEGSRQ
jgi:uncharacterized membrane protein YraQ (UPF0718 family)